MSDPRKQRLEETLARAREGHRDLRACIRGLEDVLARPDAATDAVDRSFQIVRAALREHFAHEERSALYAWLPKAFPNLAETLRELRAQHVPLLEELAELQELVDDDLRLRLSALVDVLKSHEAGEDEALVTARSQVDD